MNRRVVFGIALSAFLVTGTLSSLSIWPFGKVRANLFILPYNLIILGFGLELALRKIKELKPGISRAAQVAVLSVLFAGSVYADRTVYAMVKGPVSNLAYEPALEFWLEQKQKPGSSRLRFLLDAGTNFQYYWGFHRRFASRDRRLVDGAIPIIHEDSYLKPFLADVSAKLGPRGQCGWVLFEHKAKATAKLLSETTSEMKISTVFNWGGETYVGHFCKVTDADSEGAAPVQRTIIYR